MNVIVEFVKDSIVTALTTYGLVALATAVLPDLGSAAALWPVVPIAFIIQLGLKLVFSRDEAGNLRRVSRS